MNRNRLFFAVAILLVASFSCRGGAISATTPVAASTTTVNNTDVPVPTENVQDVQTEFPLPADFSNFTDMGNGAINFQTTISVQDAIAFYRDAFSKAGYTEREINTAITETTFSLVFDGHASGKAIVLQGVDLGGGITNINIRLEEI